MGDPPRVSTTTAADPESRVVHAAVPLDPRLAPRVPTLTGAPLSAFLDARLHRLFARGTWTLGREPNTQDPSGFATARLRILCARLSTYRDVAPSMTHGLLAQLARSVPGTFVDFAYLPPPRDLEILAQGGAPLWFGTSTKRAAHEFDAIFVTVSVLMELLNLPELLRGSGIALSRGARAADPAQPLVLIGGASGMAAATVHGRIAIGSEESGLVDGALIGEGEHAVPKIAQILAEMRGRPKSEILRALAYVDGFYDPTKYVHRHEAGELVAIDPVPDAPPTVKKAMVADLLP